jgi:hypothetical protein
MVSGYREPWTRGRRGLLTRGNRGTWTRGSLHLIGCGQVARYDTATLECAGANETAGSNE